MMLLLYVFYTLSDTTDDEENSSEPKTFKNIWIIYIIFGII